MMHAGLGALLAGLCASVAVHHAATPGAYPWALPITLTAVGCGAGLFTLAFSMSRADRAATVSRTNHWVRRAW
ncbi:hypothetical protein QFZ22_002853 [Streptomyces canus]|uniref:MHYT domain-containing protein n=1 Tax=Streptomyces canus TaxID=58343 RepID=A0AAW8FAL8_9ACTN|nr:hypothetical protein [Streptomyces canus]MDQ0906868.1 hypothetical protein [Streptomyces canus]